MEAFGCSKEQAVGREIGHSVRWLREEGWDWFLKALGCCWRFTGCPLRIIGESTSHKLVTFLKNITIIQFRYSLLWTSKDSPVSRQPSGHSHLSPVNRIINIRIMINSQMNRAFTNNRQGTEPRREGKQRDKQEIEWVKVFGSQFQQNICRPIQLRQQLMKSNELQRCLQHNIIYSIYCTICRKILCASCMYNSMQHRKHRVIPVESATEEIREDLRSFASKVPKILQQCDGICSSNNEYMVRMEREYNPIVARIQEFYENLRSFMKIKEKEQLNAIRDKRQSLRAEVNAYNAELNKIQLYITEKFKTYTISNLKVELILPARNILENLLQTSPYVKEPHIQTEGSKFNVDVDKIRTTLEEIVLRICTFIPEFQSDFNRSKYSSRMEEKSKSVSFAPDVRKAEMKIDKKKRMNSSVAGARTQRKH